MPFCACVCVKILNCITQVLARACIYSRTHADELNIYLYKTPVWTYFWELRVLRVLRKSFELTLKNNFMYFINFYLKTLSSQFFLDKIKLSDWKKNWRKLKSCLPLIFSKFILKLSNLTFNFAVKYFLYRLHSTLYFNCQSNDNC